MADKTKVMAAIKGRKGVAPKKGAVLVGIMAKLTAKRESAKGSEGKVHDGKGGMGDLAKKLYSKAKAGVKKIGDVIAGPQENYLKAQDEKMKKLKKESENPDNFN